MTHNEAIILSAYTGFLFVEDFSEVHKFCEDLLGRPIFTSEFANDLVAEEIRKKCKPLIFEMQKPKTNYDKIRNMTIEEMATYLCSAELPICPLQAPHCRDNNCSKCFEEWLKSEESESKKNDKL